MTTNRKAPDESEANQISSGETRASTLPKTTRLSNNSKQYAILIPFASGAKLNRFQAARLGDSCLNSTISTLQKCHGIHFSRRRIKVPNRFGKKTPCCEYWLEGESLRRAVAICGKADR